jgi:hypothetical protein
LRPTLLLLLLLLLHSLLLQELALALPEVRLVALTLLLTLLPPGVPLCLSLVAPTEAGLLWP